MSKLSGKFGGKKSTAIIPTINKYTPAGVIVNADANPAFPLAPTVGDAREIPRVGGTAGTVGGLNVTPGDLLVFGLSGWFVLQGDELTVPLGLNTFYVDTFNGNDTTALVNRIDKPFATLSFAIDNGQVASGVHRSIIIAGGSTISNSCFVFPDSNFSIQCMGRVTFASSFSFLGFLASPNTFNINGGGNSVFFGSHADTNNKYVFDNFDNFAPTTGGDFSTGGQITFRNMKRFFKNGSGFLLPTNFGSVQSITFENISDLTLPFVRMAGNNAIPQNCRLSIRNCPVLRGTTSGVFGMGLEIDSGTIEIENCGSFTFPLAIGAFTNQQSTSTFRFINTELVNFATASRISSVAGSVSTRNLVVRNTSVRFGNAAMFTSAAPNTVLNLNVSNIRRTNATYYTGTINTVNNTPDYIVTTL